MFGRAQFQAGLLVDPIDSEKFDPADEEKLVAFRNKIWCVLCNFNWRVLLFIVVFRPVVEKANAFAPQHSRIFKEVRSFPLCSMDCG